MPKKENPFTGRWRITDMELWDADAFDLMGPAHIEFGPEGAGRLQFIAVQADLDCRLSERDGLPLVEFSWEGDDDGEHTCGRGWATLIESDHLDGRIYIHHGDDSSFAAKREPSKVGNRK